MNKFINLEYPTSGPVIKVSLTARTTVSEQGFGYEWSTYPCTIVPARYSGGYEGGAWLCFPVKPSDLYRPVFEDWDGSDIECPQFWGVVRDQGWPVGRGDSPSGAYTDLVAQLCEKAGVDTDPEVVLD